MASAYTANCRTAVGLTGLLAMLAHFGCGGEPISSKTSKFEVADDSDRTSAKSEQSSAASELRQGSTKEKEKPSNSLAKAARKPAKEQAAGDEVAERQPQKNSTSGLYKAPKGPPSVQLEFIKRISQTPPQGNSQQSQMVDYEDKMNAVFASCDAILKHKDATDDEKRTAITTKFLELSRMAALLEKSEYAKQALDFAAELQTKKKGTVEQELGVAIGAALLPDQFAQLQKPTDADVKKLVDGYLSYLAEGPLPPLHEPGIRTIQALYGIGKRSEAIAVAEAMMAAFSGAADLPGSEAMVSNIETLLRSVKLDFTKKLIAAAQSDSAFAEFDTTLDEFLKDRKISGDLLQSIYQAASMLERSGKSESAKKVFDRLAKMDDANIPKELSKQLKSLLESAAARGSLLGSPLDFVANDSTGKEFKLSGLKGKRVLVLFWSARDEGSMQELANIQQTLLTTKSAFEVVVVNIDDDPKLFEQFSANQKVPWAAASLACPDAEKPGPSSELEKKIGLNQVPYSILVNAEGNVEAVFAQGPRLEAIIAADAPPAEKADAEKAPPTEEKKAAPAEAAKKNEAAPKDP
jgi:hypothetical protein